MKKKLREREKAKAEVQKIESIMEALLLFRKIVGNDLALRLARESENFLADLNVKIVFTDDGISWPRPNKEKIFWALKGIE